MRSRRCAGWTEEAPAPAVTRRGANRVRPAECRIRRRHWQGPEPSDRDDMSRHATPASRSNRPLLDTRRSPRSRTSDRHLFTNLADLIHQVTWPLATGRRMTAHRMTCRAGECASEDSNPSTHMPKASHAPRKVADQTPRPFVHPTPRRGKSNSRPHKSCRRYCPQPLALTYACETLNPIGRRAQRPCSSTRPFASVLLN